MTGREAFEGLIIVFQYFVLLLLPKKARTVRFRLDTKIHVEKGYRLEAFLDLRFEFVDRLKGADNTSSSHNIIETIDDSAPKPGMAFLFEMRRCDREEDEQEQEQEQEQKQRQDDPSILALPVTHIVDMPLTPVPPSYWEDIQKVHILAIAVSQDEITVVTVSRKGGGVKFFLDLWDLKGYHYFSNSQEKKDLIKSRRPVAWIAFTIDGVESFDMSFLDVALSSNGELMTVFGKPRGTSSWRRIEGEKSPLRVFQRNTITPSTTGAAAATEVTTVKKQMSEKETSAVSGSGNQAVPRSKGFEEVRCDKVSPLFTFAGFAKFQHCSEQCRSDNRQSTDPQEFVLVTCSGRCLKVYEA